MQKNTPDDLQETKGKKEHVSRFHSLTSLWGLTSAEVEGASVVVKIWPALGLWHVFDDKNMNRLSGTHFKVFATSIRRHTSSTDLRSPPPEGTPVPIQESHHVAAIRSILATDRDGSRGSRRQLSILILLLVQDSATTLQLDEQLGITTDNSPTCQSQLLRLNPGGYKDQQIQTDQLKSTFIHIQSTASVRYKYASSEEVTSIILRAHITLHWQFFSASVHYHYADSFSLPVLSFTTYWFSRLRILGRHHTCALIWKASSFSLCFDWINCERSVTCGGVLSTTPVLSR